MEARGEPMTWTKTCAELLDYVAERSKTPPNKAQQELCTLVQDKGVTPIAVGWPDLVVFSPDGKLVALIEVKPEAQRDPYSGLKAQQELLLRALVPFGVPCFRWSRADGLRKVRPDGLTEPIPLDSILPQ
jgi:hypothetical protein